MLYVYYIDIISGLPKFPNRSSTDIPMGFNMWKKHMLRSFPILPRLFHDDCIGFIRTLFLEQQISGVIAGQQPAREYFGDQCYCHHNCDGRLVSVEPSTLTFRVLKNVTGQHTD